jgi:hypothetical protein
MPPYQNDSLHDMHALMQQLDNLNVGNKPDHLEVFGKLFGNSDNKPAPAPAPSDGNDSTSMLSRMTGGMLGGKKAEPSPKDDIWKNLEAPERLIVFQNTFKDIAMAMHSDEFNNLKQLLESNAKTKALFLPNIVLKPILKG